MTSGYFPTPDEIERRLNQLEQLPLEWPQENVRIAAEYVQTLRAAGIPPIYNGPSWGIALPPTGSSVYVIDEDPPRWRATWNGDKEFAFEDLPHLKNIPPSEFHQALIRNLEINVKVLADRRRADPVVI